MLPEVKASPAVSSTLNNKCDNKCGNCDTDLSDRYILCAQCQETLCLNCFANGAEMRNHKNDHPYKIINHDFNLFDNTDWTAKEELALLNGLLNYGNWQSILKQSTVLSHRSVDELKQHYDHYYLEKAGSDQFPNIELQENVQYKPLMPYRFKTNEVPDPIRGDDNVYAGYSAARSDFEYDYDKNAEDMVAKLDSLNPSDADYALLSNLQVGILNAYRRRQGERQRRKAVIREHGLIMPQKTKSWLQRYYTTITPMVCDKLTRFMQFYTGQKFVYLMEGLHRIGELKLQTSRLYFLQNDLFCCFIEYFRLIEYRRHGICTLQEAKLYLRLKKHREACMKDLKRFQQASELSFKYKQPVSLNVGVKRRGLTPLDIVGLPGYEKITTNERDLCRTIRLSPDNYLDLKQILIQENNKLGYLKLLTARRLLKIDVNKTRKLYDFLISEGQIVPKVND